MLTAWVACDLIFSNLNNFDVITMKITCLTISFGSPNRDSSPYSINRLFLVRLQTSPVKWEEFHLGGGRGRRLYIRNFLRRAKTIPWMSSRLQTNESAARASHTSPHNLDSPTQTQSCGCHQII